MPVLSLGCSLVHSNNCYRYQHPLSTHSGALLGQALHVVFTHTIIHKRSCLRNIDMNQIFLQQTLFSAKSGITFPLQSHGEANLAVAHQQQFFSAHAL